MDINIDSPEPLYITEGMKLKAQELRLLLPQLINLPYLISLSCLTFETFKSCPSSYIRFHIIVFCFFLIIRNRARKKKEEDEKKLEREREKVLKKDELSYRFLFQITKLCLLMSWLLLNYRACYPCLLVLILRSFD